VNEPERIRKKHAQGVDFFTSQVMFDSNDLVGLIQRLNGVEARIFISFAPSATAAICNSSVAGR